MGGALAPIVSLLLLGSGSAVAQVVLDGSAGPAGTLPGPDFQIGAGLGTRAGPNLFHSFARFGLRSGESATFSGPDAIRHVISRVTGGERSKIDGTLRSTMPQADFWLVNPAGVLFGPEARLDVPGSFHVSTADEIRFADGARFSARDPSAGSFTVAAPEAFGFLGTPPGAITVDRSRLELSGGGSLSLVGGDLVLQGPGGGFIDDFANATLRVEDGGIRLVAVAGEAEVGGDGSVRGRLLGSIRLEEAASISVGGDAPGSLTVHAAGLTLAGSSLINHASIAAGGGALDLWLPSQLLIDHSAVTTASFGPAAAAPLVVRTGTLSIRDAGLLGSLAFASGNAGRVQVDAGTVVVAGSVPTALTGIASQAAAVSSGDAGTVSVTAADIRLVGAGQINGDAFGSGAAGTVRIRTGGLSIEGDGSFTPAGLTSSAQSPQSGNSGTIRVEADAIVISGGGRIKTDSFGRGNAGVIAIDAADLRLTGIGSGIPSAIANSSGENAAGDGGSITIVADRLSLRDGAQVVGATVGAASAGAITIRATGIEVVGSGGESSAIASSTVGRGPAGAIRIEAEELVMEEALIDSSTLSDAPGGAIVVEVGRLQLGADAFISSLAADLEQDAVLDEPSALEGAGGRIEVAARESVHLVSAPGAEQSAAISTASTTGGRAGDIRIVAPEIRLVGRTVSSDAFGSGRAGTVILEAGDRLLLDRGWVTTLSLSGGGGEIRLLAPNLIDLRESQMITSVAGGTDPTAGNIVVHPEILIIDRSLLQANAPAGFGGNLTLTADNILVAGGDFEALLARGDISATGGDPERAGTIVVDAPEVDLAGGLVVLETGFVDAASLLRAACAARRDVGLSSLTGVGRGGLPPSPDAPLLVDYAPKDGPHAAAAAPTVILACGRWG